jgi:hypothetical protein
MDLKKELLREVRRELGAARETVRRPFVKEVLDFGQVATDDPLRNYIYRLPDSVFRRQSVERAEGKSVSCLPAKTLRAAGARPNDRVYLGVLSKGSLLLLGSMRIRSFSPAKRDCGWPCLGRPGTEHAVGVEGTRIRLDRVLPDDVVRQLEIVRWTGRVRLEMAHDGRIADRALTGVQELYPTSAAILDEWLEDGKRSNIRRGR